MGLFESVDLICLPIATWLVFVPNWIKYQLLRKAGMDASKYNESPREYVRSMILANGPLSAQIARCNAAHENGWESLLMFAIGVMCARYGETNLTNRAIACLVVVGCRAIYNFAYVFDMSLVRTCVWWIHYVAIMYLQVIGVYQAVRS